MLESWADGLIRFYRNRKFKTGRASVSFSVQVSPAPLSLQPSAGFASILTKAYRQPRRPCGIGASPLSPIAACSDLSEVFPRPNRESVRAWVCLSVFSLQPRSKYELMPLCFQASCLVVNHLLKAKLQFGHNFSLC